MTDLEELAEDSATVYSIADARGIRFEIRSLSTDPAEEVGDETFPQYGDWLPVVDESGEETHVEAVQALAKLLVEAGAEEGDVFELVSVSKAANGRWVVEGSLVDG